VAVVEVDVETGEARLVRHIAVDDCGNVLNPLLAQGQQHGGIAQGAAQALFEEVVFDPDGNPRTTSLLDYCMPSINEFPSFETDRTITPTHLNPLGVKGIGESGTIGAGPAVHNAVIDALSHLGVRHLDMPMTPEKVWNAIRTAPTPPVAPPP
jgi:carbon-monoxide dehydrogenase large subunit